jgi:hypothetical protein
MKDYIKLINEKKFWKGLTANSTSSNESVKIACQRYNNN